jgi:Chaperone of endosialidase/Repeat of unknown function (DUF5907)
MAQPVYADNITISGDGTDEHPLAVIASGSGVTSLNGLSGVVVLESVGGTVAITKPGGGDINLDVVSATSGQLGAIQLAGDLGNTATSPEVLSTHLSAPLPILQGGTGTTTPAIVAGTNVTITGSWPDQTITVATGAGGVTTLNALAGAVVLESTGGTIAITKPGGLDINVDVVSATSGQLGAIQLAGDLGNTAASPQVVSTHLASALPVAQGGTGLTAGTSGGILAYTATGTLASSAALAAGGIVLGGGAGVVPLTNTALTFASPTLTVGLSGSSSGILSLAGSTSGHATITAPAVAGTVNNAIAFSNVISVPAGTLSNPGILFGTGSTLGGIFTASNIGVEIQYAGTNCLNISTGQLELPNNATLQWSASTNPETTFDSGISRISAGVLGFGNGNLSDVSGTVSAAHFTAGGNAGVSAGPFTTISSITTTSGIVTALTGTSDARLKKFRFYHDGLTSILQINPIVYRWNDDGQKYTGLSGDRDYVGFLAQDVQMSIPEAITGFEGTAKYLSLDDRPIIAALVNAVKELNLRMERLESK